MWATRDGYYTAPTACDSIPRGSDTSGLHGHYLPNMHTHSRVHTHRVYIQSTHTQSTHRVHTEYTHTGSTYTEYTHT